MVALKGLEKFAPKDFPGFISSTVFLPGCNFRCPYCQNADLIARPETLATIPLDFFLAYLDSRKGWLEGICISGGEPLLEPALEELLSVIRARGLLIKIDTNGSLSGRLENLFDEELVDRVAMDVKAPLARYPEVTRSAVLPGEIERSVQIIRHSGLNYLFRTTVVPGLVGEEDILKISRWLEGSPVFQIQQFSPAATLDAEFMKIKPYGLGEIQKMAEIAKPFFTEVRIEGA